MKTARGWVRVYMDMHDHILKCLCDKRGGRKVYRESPVAIDIVVIVVIY